MQMQTQQEDIISNVTIVGVALACVLTIVFNSGTFTLWSMLEGAVLLLLLLAYSKHGDASQTRIQHLLTSALFALSSLIFLGWL